MTVPDERSGDHQFTDEKNIWRFNYNLGIASMLNSKDTSAVR